MVDIQAITPQIKRNCDISDAKYWGAFSICTFLLKLRELYRTENCVKPWEKIQKNEIDKWISEREKLWKKLEKEDFGDIFIDGNSYSPFEVKKINAELEKDGFIYGAGLGVYMKPSFFLADLLSRKTIHGYDVYIAGDEYARDLSDYPATLQEKAIFVRTEAAKLLIWEKFEELRLRGIKSAPEYLVFAFLKYNLMPENELIGDIAEQLSLIASSEIDTYIYHEVGEAIEGEQLGNEWHSLFAELLSYRRAEIFARRVKDLLSDTSEKGMLKYIIENGKEGSLGFYIVFLDGYRKLLFPEIMDAFKKFVEIGDWEIIEDARKTGYSRARAYVDSLLYIYRRYKSEKGWVSRYIEDGILSGIG
ncbi:MAG: Sfum_1244 family protein [Nitrospirota bacterium]